MSVEGEHDMTSRIITREEYIRLGTLAWFVRGEDFIRYYTNTPAR